MFTLCTRTVYLGADFCSTNARTFIISDANIESLAVDISLDLPQILGRQRLDENPWKNDAIFYYKPLIKSKIVPKDVFDSRIEKKEKETLDLLEMYKTVGEEQRQTLIDRLVILIDTLNYKRDYLSIDRVKTGNKVLDPISGNLVDEYVRVPVENKLVKISEQRAYDIQQIDYADRFVVFNLLKTKIVSTFGDEITNFLDEYEQKSSLVEKLKFLCTMNFPEEVQKAILANIADSRFNEYYTILGPERIKSLGYNITRLNNELEVAVFNTDLLENLIYSNFKVGDKISLAAAKTILKDIYFKCGYNRAAKAKDLEYWFDTSEIYISEILSDGSRKNFRGYEILSKKGDIN